MIYVFYMIITGVCIQTISANTIDDVKTLMANLMANYSREIRPVKDQARPVHVDVNMALVSINDFNEVTGVISVVALLFLSWTDESLVWDPSIYHNTTSITFSQRKIWLPQMYLINTADDFNPISNKHFKVTVQANGSVYWVPGRIIQATCTPDVSKFPFDQQTCTIQITTHGYLSTQVWLNTTEPTINLTYFSTNSGWSVISTRTFAVHETINIASFSITMDRRPLNFMVSVVIPIMMLAMVNPFVFILPFNSGERVSYSITVLLAFTVYMTVVSDRMPASSDPMSHLSYYLLSMLAISVVIVTMNMFQIRTHNKHENDESVPQWIKNLISYFHKICRNGKVETNVNDQMKQIPERKYSIKSHTIMRLDSIEGTDITNTLKHPVEKTQIQTVFSQNEMITWHTVARYMDKLYFTVFLILNVFESLGFFLSVIA